ncbi:MAG: radical SAM family heme chaperone HemW [Bdellovibrionales bacterium]|nr:radical SAM family heme chaperone HemW [Bdellovibrionales bacterium]
MKSFSLYLHIPFCLHKCPYCDFNTYAVSRIPEEEYVNALLAELDAASMQERWRGRQLSSIYFGGGTPSLFCVASIERIIQSACSLFELHPLAEVTLEANPGAVDHDYLRGLRQVGVNRLSLGAQSFHLETLKVLGRLHEPAHVTLAVENAHQVGITDINIDLIHGVPSQSVEMVERDLKIALKLAPTHISAYGLTIEKGTPFYGAVRRGALVLPGESTLVEMFQLVNSTLAGAGFIHYEISNFARFGKFARHNLSYWEGRDYLGLGAGAHSFWRDPARAFHGERWSNFALPNRYIEETSATGMAVAWRDELSREALMFEFFFLGLRKRDGISLNEFQKGFGLTFEEAYPQTSTILLDQEFLQMKNGRLSLTEKGLLVADSVIENFVEVECSTPRPKPYETASLQPVGGKIAVGGGRE